MMILKIIINKTLKNYSMIKKFLMNQIMSQAFNLVILFKEKILDFINISFDKKSFRFKEYI